jgi:peptide/nickel transport system ATP-binding protein
MAAPTDAPLLVADDVRVDYTLPGMVVHAVRRLSHAAGSGEVAGLVGASGFRKSVSAAALFGLVPKSARISSVSIKLHGRELVGQAAREFQEIRATELAMVFQEPPSSLNPRRTVVQQFAESLQADRECRRAKAHARAVELELVGIVGPERRVNSYPRAGKAWRFKGRSNDHRAHRRVVKGGRATRAGMPNAAGKEG